MPARQVFDVFEDLASLFGPTMASLAQAARVASASVAGPPVRTQEVADGEQQAEAPAADLTDIDISAAITTLSMRLVADRALYGIVRRLLHDLTDDNRHLVGQRDEVFDYYFRGGQTARLLPIVGWALTMNYADFFGWLGGNVNAQNIAEKLTSLLHKG